MLLKDFTQVSISPFNAEEVFAEDDELRQDLKEKLDEAEEQFFSSEAPEGEELDEEEFFAKYIKSSSFIDATIERSTGSSYDLSLIPRSYVERQCEYLSGMLSTNYSYPGTISFGSFEIHKYINKRQRFFFGFRHEVETKKAVIFDREFGSKDLWDNKYSLPESMVSEFWESMARRIGNGFSGWQEGTSYFGSNQGQISGGTYYIVSSEEDFLEFCRDIMGDYVEAEAKRNPNTVLRAFYGALANATPATDARAHSAPEFWSAEGIEKTVNELIAENQISKSEVLEYAIQALSSEEDDRIRALRGFEYRITALEDQDAAFEEFIESISEHLPDEHKTTLNALIESNSINKKEMLKKAELLFREKDDVENYVRDEIIDEISEYLDTMTTGQDVEDRTPIITIDHADLKQMGIDKGVFLEEAPWKLIKLRAFELPEEGRVMRHCVGDKGMGYARAVHRGEIEIWSLRDRHNKPQFTLEVDANFHKEKPDESDLELSGVAAKRRATAVKQLKGKANRTPGFAEKASTDISRNAEVIVWKWILKKLHINPEGVLDFGACRIKPKPATEAITGSFRSSLSFDQPYQPSLTAINGYVLEAAALLSGARRKVPKKYTAGLGKTKTAKRKAEIRKRAEEPHTDPKSYRPFKTDVDKRTGKPIETKESQYTKDYRKKFGAATEVEAKSSGSEKLSKALKKKSEDSGIPVRILRQVYNRGLAAWRTGHRPGASQHAWGMGRVNSFIMKGKTWKTADADLAKKARAAKKVKAAIDTIDEVVALLGEDG